MSNHGSSPETSAPAMKIEGARDLRAPAAARRRFDQLLGQRQSQIRSHRELEQRLEKVKAYLGLADAIEDALDKLSQKLFGELVGAIEQKLTEALREVLEQPLALKIEREWKRGGVTMSMHIERDGKAEDVMRGQGGSVANVLSVGLRLLALVTLDQKKHRRFLVLDEQDCWLRPDLVPRLVKIIHEAARAFGFQVLLISHHDVHLFERYADRIYRFTPTADGVSVARIGAIPQGDG